ncbi:hypothetical protein AGRA3207_001377 [Actinomadura graeca]|uniref:Uncharacterized protein n=1 Tax=Actinomadura graeca TaxID=2750812 RepID=A0ABX8QQZ6_9ACTN|nr:hypothetical protein [Actinomadura graeca]QXJ20629.1 hypothetical protein AGRA3207_001377 [Actinomadura graeca]
MSDSSEQLKIDLQEVRARNLTAREILSALSDAMPSAGDLWLRLNSALGDISALISETTRLVAALAKVRRDRANLVAAGRATLNAAHDAEPDPLYYLRDELRAQGHLPPGPWGRS